MKPNILCIFAATLACAAGCSPRDVEVGPYTVSVIMDNVYHIQDCTAQNPAGESFNEAGEKSHFNNCSDMYLVVGSESALLIDLSNEIEGAGESLRSLISDRVGDKPLIITFTHNHGDHTGMFKAMTEYPGVSFACPRIDFESLEPILLEYNMPYCMIDEAYSFDLGGYVLDAVLVPGHTAGSMVFFLKDKDIIFSGDAIGSGHGVWIFNQTAYQSYALAVPHLIDVINQRGVNKDALQIYGGHYWQKDWLDLPEGREMGMSYLDEMQELIIQMSQSVALYEPSGLDHPVLDTYFRNHNAIIAYNLEMAGIAD